VRDHASTSLKPLEIKDLAESTTDDIADTVSNINMLKACLIIVHARHAESVTLMRKIHILQE